MPSPREQDSSEVLARVREHLPLVEVAAKQILRQLGPAVTLDELVSYGHEGLLVASRTFDAARGVPFRSWAYLRIRGAVLDGVRAHATLPRSAYRKLRAIEAASTFQDAAQEDAAATRPASAEEADAKLGGFLEGMAMAMAMATLSKTGEEIERAADPGAQQEEALARAQLHEAVRAAVANRPDAERVLLEEYYFQDRTLEEAAGKLGLSKSWACRIHARAIEGVARELKRRKLGG
jgi:RNA polymerase sigma factor for flagellar operon FliA